MEDLAKRYLKEYYEEKYGVREIKDMEFLEKAIEEVKGFLKELSRRDKQDTKLS